MPLDQPVTETAELELGTRFLPLAQASWNAETRTIEAVFTTGARVPRRDLSGRRFQEELVVSAEAMDLRRLNGGAPVLNDHFARGLQNQIGVVERAWIDGGQGRAILRFSDRPEVAGLVNDIAKGIFRGVSMGYQVRKYEIHDADPKALPLFRATDWEPVEISVTPVPADPGAGTRNAAPSYPVTFVRAQPQTEETRSMPEDLNPGAATPAPSTAPAVPALPVPDAATRAVPPAANVVDLDGARAEGALAERARVGAIETAARGLRLVADGGTLIPEVRALIDGGTPIDMARAQLIDLHAARATPAPARPFVTMPIGGQEETETRRLAMGEAILHRCQPSGELPERARQYRGLRLLDLARECAEAAGHRVRGLGPMDTLSLAFNMERSGGGMSTSDFPLILANIMGKTLRSSYEAAPQTFKPFCRQTTAPDFKTMTRLQLSEGPALLSVREGGEFKFGYFGEAQEQYAIATYGRRVPVTRQMIINDDLSAFSRIPANMGYAVANLESDTVYAIITANGNMADGVALFHSTHGNLAGSGSTIDVTNVGLARKAMRLQKGLDGVTFINVQPRYLVVPPGLETVAQQFISVNMLPTQTSNINVFAGTLQVIAEPRLDTNDVDAWYLFADPGQIDTIEYAYLEGQTGPYTEWKDGWEVDGMEYKVRLDFGAKAIDHRGMYKNAGAT